MSWERGEGFLLIKPGSSNHIVIILWSLCDDYLVITALNRWADKRRSRGKKVDEGRGRELVRIRFCASQRTESQTNSIFTGTLILKYSNTDDTSNKRSHYSYFNTEQHTFWSIWNTLKTILLNITVEQIAGSTFQELDHSVRDFLKMCVPNPKSFPEI